MNDRKNKILEILSAEQKKEVAALSEQLGVSQVTVRKDLDCLEKKGIIKREHGFAVLLSTNDILCRLAYHYETKKQIALAASEMVRDGETIMIESGSCCAILAETLAKTKKNLTVITNSAFIADYIRNKTNFEIVLLGGIYQHDSQVLVGPMVRQCSDFTNEDQLRAQAVRDMALQAENIIVLTESEKFEKHGTVPLNISGLVSHIFTDSGIPDTIEDYLINQSVKINKVASGTGIR